MSQDNEIKSVEKKPLEAQDEYQSLLPWLEVAVIEAGKRLIAEAARPVPRGQGPDKLEVDVEIERELRAAIMAHCPNDAIHGEELDERSGSSGRVWIIDPHDGTSEFSKGARETSISVALWAKGALRLGLVYVPCAASITHSGLRQLFQAKPLLASWAEGGAVTANSKAVPSLVRDRLNAETKVAISRRVHGEVLEANARALAPAQLVPCASIATRLMLAAVGLVDLGFMLKNPLSSWDFAGGHALLIGAGGLALNSQAQAVDWSSGPRQGCGPALIGSRSPALAREAARRLNREYPSAIKRPADEAGGAPDWSIYESQGSLRQHRLDPTARVLKIPLEKTELAREIAKRSGLEPQRGGANWVFTSWPPKPPAPVGTEQSFDTLAWLEERCSLERAWEQIREDRARRRDSIASEIRGLEAQVAAKPEECFDFDRDGAASLKVNDRSYSAGRLRLLKIKELRKSLNSRPGSPAPIRVSVLEGNGGGSQLTDIGFLQGWAPDGAVFQLASQFNGLEAVAPFVSPVASYLSDSTQGPRAAISALPGTLLRHYQAPDEEGRRFTQSTKHSLNLLSSVLPDEMAEVTAGYLMSDGIHDPKAVAARLEEQFEDLLVALHDRIEVCYGLNWSGPIRSPAPLIAQVCASTIALGGYSSKPVQGDAWTSIIRSLQRSAYTGAVLSALELDAPLLVLTMVGGGVFHNPRELIVEALSRSIRESSDYARKPLHILVNCYSPVDSDCTPTLRSLVQDFKGRWIRL